MALLVIAEHNNAAIGAATLNAVAAAQKIGGEIHVLVAGSGHAGILDIFAWEPDPVDRRWS